MKEDAEPKKAASVEAPGHRSGPRALALSSDNAVLLSTAAGEVKLWNPQSGACLRTIESGQVGRLPHATSFCMLQCWRQRWVSYPLSGNSSPWGEEICFAFGVCRSEGAVLYVVQILRRLSWPECEQ